jgi:hypothetical protein
MEFVIMGRPKKYTSNAEKARAFRMRKKLAESETPEELNELARVLHRVYKDRAAKGFPNHQQLIGATPFETLIRVVLYEALFEAIESDGTVKDFPGWDKVIVPYIDSISGMPGYSIEGVKDPVPTHLALHLAEDEPGDY